LSRQFDTGRHDEGEKKLNNEFLSIQGGNQTFGEGFVFTEHLKEVVQEALPKVNVRILVYPQYETRGDLGQCVMRFRNW
jgi:hypothetical protein